MTTLAPARAHSFRLREAPASPEPLSRIRFWARQFHANVRVMRRGPHLSGLRPDPRATLVGLLLLAASTGCAPDPEPPPPDESLAGCGWGGTAGETGGEGDVELLTASPQFQDYLANHVVEHEDGWVVEGDIFTNEFDHVVAAYRVWHEPSSSSEGLRGSVKCDDDLPIDELLDPARKLNLTYCLNDTWDAVPEFRSEIIPALRQAASQWESAGDINFVELGHGSACSHENGAFFTVEYGGKECTIFGCFNGLAFWPNDPTEERVVYFYEDLFTDDEPLKPQRIATHELGHVLGLWHEQARFDGVLCGLAAGSPGDYRGVTRGDAVSVMAYPSCEDTNPTPRPSALDRVTLAHLYNLPRPRRRTQKSDSGVLVWHRPQAAEFILWEPDGVGGFLSTTDCYLPGCDLGHVPRWKPILYNETGSIDAFMYGPGFIEDVRVRDIGGAWSSDTIHQLGSNNDVPVLLDGFFAQQDHSIWWIRLEGRSDYLWRNLDGAVAASSDFDQSTFSDGPHLVTHARSDGAQNQTLWMSPLDNTLYLTWYEAGQLDQVALDKTGCLLASGVAYDALPGDYDGDGSQEIAWYDFQTGELIYWPAVPNCLGHRAPSSGRASPQLSAWRETRLV